MPSVFSEIEHVAHTAAMNAVKSILERRKAEAAKPFAEPEPVLLAHPEMDRYHREISEKAKDFVLKVDEWIWSLNQGNLDPDETSRLYDADYLLFKNYFWRLPDEIRNDPKIQNLFEVFAIEGLENRFNTAVENARKKLEEKQEPRREWTEESIREAYNARFEVLQKMQEALRTGGAKGIDEFDTFSTQLAIHTIPGIYDLTPDSPLGVLDLELFQRYSLEYNGLLNDRGRVLSGEPYEAPTSGAPPGPTPDQKLGDVREAFVKAEKKLADFGRVKKFFGGHKTVKGEYEKAAREYQQARAELNAANAENVLGTLEKEEEKLLDERIGIYEREKKAKHEFKGKNLARLALGLSHRFYEFHKGLARIPLAPGKLGRFINLRTAISGGLLVGGAVAGVAGGMGVFAGMALTAPVRRAASGFGAVAGYGIYDMLNAGAQAWDRRDIEKKMDQNQEGGSNGLTLDQVQDYILRIQSRLMLDGKNQSDLRADALYQRLLGERARLLREEMVRIEKTNDTKGTLNLVSKMSARSDAGLAKHLRSQKNWRTARKIFGTAVGMTVASPLLAEAAEYVGGKAKGAFDYAQGFLKERSIPEPEEAFRPTPAPAGSTTSPQPSPPKGGEGIRGEIAPPQAKEPLPQSLQQGEGKTSPSPTPSTTADRPPINIAGEEIAGAGKGTSLGKTELLHQGKPTGAYLEAQADKIVLHAGSRGIEGALLDMKGTPQYDRMLKWLEENYTSKTSGADNSPGALVHRYVLEYANENELTIGGGGKDLNLISGADLEIDPESGQIEMDTDDIKFVETAGAESPSPQALTSPLPSPSPGQGMHWETPELDLASEDIDAEATKAIADLQKEQIPPKVEAVKESLAQLKKQVAGPETPPLEQPRIRLPDVVAPQTSDLGALRIAMGPDKYASFLKDVLEATEGKLTQVENLTLDAMTERFLNGSDEFKRPYLGLMEKVEAAIQKGDLNLESTSTKTVSEFVRDLAKKYNER